MNLLLIDDNPDHYLLVRRALEAYKGGYQLTFVKTGDEGVAHILTGEYDAVLCDYRLGSMNALDVLQRIGKQGIEVPFIVVTSAGNEHAAVELMKAGAYDYVEKDRIYDASLDILIRAACDRFKMRVEKIQAERALKLSEEKYRSLVEHLPAVTYLALINDFSTTVYISPQITVLLGYSIEEINREPDFWVKHMHPDDVERVRDLLKRAHRTFEPYNAEYRLIGRDGQIVWFKDNATIMHNSQDGAFYLHGVMFDITEQKKVQEELQGAYRDLKHAQEELIQSGKMAAMGQLATGISHELNQPLTGIKGFAQVLLADLEPSSPLRADVGRIIEQADRMDKIVKNVRFFARKSEFKMEAVDINCPIEDSLVLLAEQLKLHNIILEKNLAPGLPVIIGDHNQLQQAFINLTTNARDAVDAVHSPHGGTISVRSGLLPGGKSIEIVFSDTGCGISKENLRSIFNPFFTTKSPNGGMGLGLSIVYRIIENHKGTIVVTSEEGKGAVFTLTLPVAQGAPG